MCTKICAISDSFRDPFRPHVPKLLEALLDCFKDQSWPVRDAACMACSEFVVAFPEEAKGKLEELLHLWKAHLSDNIFSVREHSAMALINVMKVYEKEVVDLTKEYLAENLLKAKDQPS